MLTLTVHGTPIPQGSHRGFVVNGRAVITADNKKTKPWRQDIVAAALNTVAETPGTYPMGGPLSVVLEFRLPRIKGHYRTGAHAHQLRPDAPTYSEKKPDVDKLARAVLDALTVAGVWRDDSQVAVLTAVKLFAAPGHTGVTVRVEPVHASFAVPGVVASPRTTPGTVSVVEQGMLL